MEKVVEIPMDETAFRVAFVGWMKEEYTAEHMYKAMIVKYEREKQDIQRNIKDRMNECKDFDDLARQLREVDGKVQECNLAHQVAREFYSLERRLSCIESQAEKLRVSGEFSVVETKLEEMRDGCTESLTQLRQMKEMVMNKGIILFPQPRDIKQYTRLSYDPDAVLYAREQFRLTGRFPSMIDSTTNIFDRVIISKEFEKWDQLEDERTFNQYVLFPFFEHVKSMHLHQ